MKDIEDSWIEKWMLISERNKEEENTEGETKPKEMWRMEAEGGGRE